jgi:hypothetical protein
MTYLLNNIFGSMGDYERGLAIFLLPLMLPSFAFQPVLAEIYEWVVDKGTIYFSRILRPYPRNTSTG